ncbi:YihY/virulence factor BrkB family protein [Propionibacterium sp. oral taxon 192]|uniref:YihY/virulence factor BrkB family protein n=1 Tax=Propionibacterium sp. oral taxon 192 TaxID=671222 RepID=UPI0018DCB437|nr:YihY/virulence factor BrkB family protein [Propionibacterium sp. oral taxon 192]
MNVPRCGSRRHRAILLARSTLNRFNANQATDIAAGLTYYSVLAVFPALLCVVSLLKLSRLGRTLVPELSQLLQQSITDPGTARVVTNMVTTFFDSTGAGLGLVVGLLVAMWSASGYVAAFSRAANRVYDVEEGRGTVRLKATQFGLTAVVLVGFAILVGLVTLSGEVLHWLGARLGAGNTALTVWSIVKWPVVMVIVMGMVAMLYHFCPNAELGKFRFITPGSVLAVLVALAAASGFGFYASGFGSYDATYGTLGGIIIALWLIWLVNIAMLLGVYLDAQRLRLRQIARGEVKARRGAVVAPRAMKGIVAGMRKDNKLAADLGALAPKE